MPATHPTLAPRLPAAPLPSGPRRRLGGQAGAQPAREGEEGPEKHADGQEAEGFQERCGESHQEQGSGAAEVRGIRATWGKCEG